MVTVSETLAEAERNLRLAETHPEILPSAVLYPTHLVLDQAERRGLIEQDHVLHGLYRATLELSEMGPYALHAERRGKRGAMESAFASLSRS